MATKSETKEEVLKRLFKENGLLKEDVHVHKHYNIITRSGIEKIQYKNGIIVEFDGEVFTPELCVVKARAHKIEGDKPIHVQTFGSAGHNGDGKVQQGKGNQYNYYPELAEKRALSRAVLKISGFYQYQVFGEDEIPAEQRGERVDHEPKGTAEAAAKEVQAPAAHTGNGVVAEDGANVKYASAKQKEEIIRLLSNPVIKNQEKTKMLLNINRLDEERAAQAIEKLKAVIEEREGETVN